MNMPSTNDGRTVEEGGPAGAALLRPHPASMIFPPMTTDEFIALRADIRDRGLVDPIVLFDGHILEGNNRYRACTEEGVAPHFTVWEGDDPIAFVISKNLHRRHLTPGQKAAIAVEAERLYKDAAQQRMLAGKIDPRAHSPEGSADMGRALHQAAKAVGASRRSAQDAKQIKREAPQAFEALKAGKTSVRSALKEAGRTSGGGGNPPKQKTPKTPPAKIVPEHIAAQARIRARDAELKYTSMLNAPNSKLNIPMLDRASKVQETLLELSGLKPEVAVTQMPAMRCREFAGEHSLKMAAWWIRFVELCEERRRTETPDLPPVYKRSRLAAVNPVIGTGGVRLTAAGQAVHDWLEKQAEPVTVIEAAVATKLNRDTAAKVLRQLCQMGIAEEVGRVNNFVLYRWKGK
jgi:hypothetical protein